MRKWLLLLLLLGCLAGCREETYEGIAPDESFVASVNMNEPSLQFFAESGQLLTTWALAKPYTGAVLVADDTLVLYGNQLDVLDYYTLSTGKHVASVPMPRGTTNGYFDEASGQLFMTNSETNTVYSYDASGALIGEVRVRNYPMAMYSERGKLYVVNYKDTLLTVVDIATLQIEAEWAIPAYSSGIWIDAANGELWLGGHGEGANANEDVRIYRLQDGQFVRALHLPSMPVAINANAREQAVASHGSSTVYFLQNGEITKQLKVAANPFALTYFGERWVVAGYDDATLYFLQNGAIVQTVATERGPFQLVMREVNK